MGNAISGYVRMGIRDEIDENYQGTHGLRRARRALPRVDAQIG